METVEGNKKIAEFFGKKTKDNIYQWEVFNDQWAAEGLRFHKSWDWLMPVVEKINNICKERGAPLSNRSKEQDYLENPLDNPLHWKSWSYHSIHNVSTNITREYERVVSFITWYNTQTP